ncbi:hypothetical protein, partial [Sinorhizobium meliloti]|uniref:hypothetical protein n=1 Tax=Rhizobium meliloti TaxID=382 RepID=UPI001AECB4C9
PEAFDALADFVGAGRGKLLSNSGNLLLHVSERPRCFKQRRKQGGSSALDRVLRQGGVGNGRGGKSKRSPEQLKNDLDAWSLTRLPAWQENRPRPAIDELNEG